MKGPTFGWLKMLSSASARFFSGLWPAASTVPFSSVFSSGEWRVGKASIGAVQFESRFSSALWKLWSLAGSCEAKVQPEKARAKPLTCASP